MYTFLFEIDSKFYAYNTLSNALIEIAEDTYKILLVNKNRHTPLQEKDLGCDELYQTLKENHMITENDRDEFLLYKSIIRTLHQYLKSNDSSNHGLQLLVFLLF